MVMEKLIRRFNTSPSSKKKLSGSAWPEMSAQMDAPSATSFGVSLTELYEKESPGVPVVVRQLCAFLCAVGGLECEGVFRVNGNSRVVEQLRARAEELQQPANSSSSQSAETTTFLDELQRQNDVHAAASLLKLFLRELPGGLVPSGITKDVLTAYGCHDSDTTLLIANVKHLLARLPAPNFLLLQFLCCFLNQVVRSERRNKMSATAIGIVFGPSVFRCPKETEVYSTQGTVNNIMSLLVERADDFFDPRVLEEARLPQMEARVLKLQKMTGDQGNRNYALSSVDGLLPFSVNPQARPRASVHSPVRDSKLNRNDWSSPERKALTPALEMCNSCGYGTGDAESAPLSPTESDLPTARSGGDDELSPGLQSSLQFCIWQHALGRPPPSVPALSRRAGVCQPKAYKSVSCEQTQKEEQQSTRSDPLRIPSPSKTDNPSASSDKRPSNFLKAGIHRENASNGGSSWTAEQSTHVRPTPLASVCQVKQSAAFSRPEPRRTHPLDGQLEAFRRTSFQDGDKLCPQRASAFLLMSEIHDLGDLDLRHGTTDRRSTNRPLLSDLQSGTVPRRSSPAVVDSTGHNPAGGPNLSDLSLEESFAFLVDRLSRKREQANRPIRVAEMTVREVEAEKLALQKALLSFENAHGRPTGHHERLTMRPLYDRYRIMKRVLAAFACATAANSSGPTDLDMSNPVVGEVARRLPNTLGPILAESEEPSADVYAVASVRQQQQQLQQQQQQQHRQPFSLQRRLISASRPAAPLAVKKPSELSATTANSQTISLHSDHNIDQVERYLSQAPDRFSEENADNDCAKTVDVRKDGIGVALPAGAPSVPLSGAGNIGTLGLSGSRNAAQSVGAPAEQRPATHGNSSVRAARDAQLHSLESQSLSSVHTLGDGVPAPEVLCRLTSVDDSDFHVLDFIRAGNQPMPAVKITQPSRPFPGDNTTGGDSSTTPVTVSAGSPLKPVAPSKLPHRTPGDLPKAILDLKADDDFANRYAAMNMLELNTEVKSIRDMKRYLQKILKDFEHDFERKQGRKLELEDRMPMQIEYNRYKQLKVRLSALEQLIDSKSTGV